MKKMGTKRDKLQQIADSYKPWLPTTQQQRNSKNKENNKQQGTSEQQETVSLFNELPFNTIEHQDEEKSNSPKYHTSQASPTPSKEL